MTAAKNRFWAKVARGQINECWEWLGVKGGKNGLYGRFWFNGKMMQAHRFSYELVNSEIPPGLLLRHKCDNPSCVNPAHLEPGSNSDNMQDMLLRKRNNWCSGERRKNAKLSDEAVSMIKQSTLSSTKLGLQYKVHPATIRRVKAGQAWRHV